MKSADAGPGQKKGQKKSDTGYENANKSISRNYKESKNSINGPNWDKKSKGVEGDSGQNAGVFK